MNLFWVSTPLEWLFLNVGLPNLTQLPPLPGLGTVYVETTQESRLVNIGGVTTWDVNQKTHKKIIGRIKNF
jgi:hypothetical protein